MTSREALAAIIDHTLLAPTASAADVEALAAEALDLGVGAVCVSPSRVRLVTDFLMGEGDARPTVASEIVLKVILESAAIVALGEQGETRLADACRAAADAGADLVKTSTGFHPAGGATIEAVALMAAAVAGRGSGTVGVKASGGIRSAADALAMVDAGATRIGASASRAILEDPLLAG